MTLAPGQSQPITVYLNKEMPHGTWLATINETSGITQVTAQATIDFYEPVPPNHRWLILAIVLIVLLLLAAGLAVWLIRRNRRSSPGPGPGHLDDVMPPRPPVRSLRLAPPR